MASTAPLAERVARFAALGDPHRLAIIDVLVVADRAPPELRRELGIASNLLAHHLRVLEAVSLVERVGSEGDRRRRYVRLIANATAGAAGVPPIPAGNVVFVCTHNSARSQLAAGLWNRIHSVPASSAGTHPAQRVHPKAVLAGAAADVDLRRAIPRSIDQLDEPPDLVITVCDRAHEELTAAPWRQLHWSLPDPARDGRRAAFDATVQRLRRRIDQIAPTIRAIAPEPQPSSGTPGKPRGIVHA